ncbi:MAG TPA: YeeE/YedE family protein [Candidatus Limnocylindrales bacterium]|nr:YeeE/YedE family protein [Candidatus Limnocylindrales bacterium]
MDDLAWPMYVSAILTGFLIGYALQRGGFCLTRAVSNAVLMGDAAILRAYLLALIVAMIGVHVLLAAGLVEIPIRPFRWIANVAGGLLFGVGMILSGGCSGSTWYRTGEGAIGAWVVLLGFAIGATTVSVGILSPVRSALQAPTITVNGGPPTLHGMLGLSPWIVIAVLTIGVGVWLVRGGGEPEHGKWPWPVTGIVVGALIAVGWWASTFGGRPVGITFAANTGQLFTYPLVGYPTRVNWSMAMLLGVPAGAWLAAWRAGEFRWKLPPGWSLVKIFGGGLLMGGAALLAEGCNINQGLTNAATLAVGSLVTFASMIAGAWLTLRLLYGRHAS